MFDFRSKETKALSAEVLQDVLLIISMASSSQNESNGKMKRDQSIGNASRWVRRLTTSQLKALIPVLQQIKTYSGAELSLIQYILQNFNFVQNVSPIGTYDTLMLHRAFFGPTVRERAQYRFTTMKELVIGLRDCLEKNLDFSTPKKKRDLEALLSFAFEAETYCESVGARRTDAKSKSGIMFFTYDNADLKELVLQYADQPDRLIECARSRKTIDPELLSIMMDEENAPALTGGAL